MLDGRTAGIGIAHDAEAGIIGTLVRPPLPPGTHRVGHGGVPHEREPDKEGLDGDEQDEPDEQPEAALGQVHELPQAEAGDDEADQRDGRRETVPVLRREPPDEGPEQHQHGENADDAEQARNPSEEGAGCASDAVPGDSAVVAEAEDGQYQEGVEDEVDHEADSEVPVGIGGHGGNLLSPQGLSGGPLPSMNRRGYPRCLRSKAANSQQDSLQTSVLPSKKGRFQNMQ